MLGKTRRVHFVGIGGIGMSGIAELLANLGYMVTGSDERESSVTDRLRQLGISVAHGHAGEHLANDGDCSDLQQAFVDFGNKVPFYGAVIACADDPNLTAALPRVTRRITKYGLDSADVNVGAADVVLGALTASAAVTYRPPS